MKQSDELYYRDRLAAERDAAHRAEHPAAAESHRRLAERYASLLTEHASVDA